MAHSPFLRPLRILYQAFLLPPLLSVVRIFTPLKVLIKTLSPPPTNTHFLSLSLSLFLQQRMFRVRFFSLSTFTAGFCDAGTSTTGLPGGAQI